MNNSKKSNITQNLVLYLNPYIRDYKAELSASQIEKLTKEPQQSISRKLNELADLNLLEYKIEGRNKQFFFNLEKQTSFTLLNLIENEKTLKFQIQKQEVSQIIEELLKHCETIILFGSYAKDKETKQSDLDILILGKSNKKEIRKFKRKQIIDITEHYLTYGEFKRLINNKNTHVVEIKKDHIIFGNISKVVKLLVEDAKR